MGKGRTAIWLTTAICGQYGGLMSIQMRQFTKIFKALSDETRLQILRYIAQEEKCVGAVAQKFNITPSAASHHLKVLEEAGFVRRHKVQRWVRYQLDLDTLRGLVEEYFAYLGLKDELRRLEDEKTNVT